MIASKGKPVFQRGLGNKTRQTINNLDSAIAAELGAILHDRNTVVTASSQRCFKLVVWTLTLYTRLFSKSLFFPKNFDPCANICPRKTVRGPPWQSFYARWNAIYKSRKLRWLANSALLFVRITGRQRW